jgi:rubrerythrin
MEGAMSKPANISSTAELFAMAHAMEHEAGRRYDDLAARMRRGNQTGLADLFSFLAGIERKHAVRIQDQSLRITGHAAADVPARWELPENFDEEAASSQLLTPYLALAIAVRNEERAFSFYCYVAAQTQDNDVRVLAEELAKDELDHATRLRRERRRAYRDPDRSAGARWEIPDTVGDLLVHAMRLEATAAMQHHRISQSELTSGKPDASRIFSEAAADEQRTALAIAARLNTTIAPGATGMALSLRDGLRILEEALNFYVDVAERSRNEAVVTEAQALAEMAVRRLSLARGGLTQAEIGAWE